MKCARMSLLSLFFTVLFSGSALAEDVLSSRISSDKKLTVTLTAVDLKLSRFTAKLDVKDQSMTSKCSVKGQFSEFGVQQVLTCVISRVNKLPNNKVRTPQLVFKITRMPTAKSVTHTLAGVSFDSEYRGMADAIAECGGYKTSFERGCALKLQMPAQVDLDSKDDSLFNALQRINFIYSSFVRKFQVTIKPKRTGRVAGFVYQMTYEKPGILSSKIYLEKVNENDYQAVGVLEDISLFSKIEGSDTLDDVADDDVRDQITKMTDAVPFSASAATP